MPDQIPLVDYLALTPEPHLVAHECTSCGARFFDRRNACAACEGDQFKDVALATNGTGMPGAASDRLERMSATGMR